jgi:hypothetical protein
MTDSDGLTGGITVAFIAVVVVGFLLGCASVVIPYGIPRSGADVTAVLYVGTIAAFVTFPFAGVSALLLGVPLFSLWRRLGFKSVLLYFLAGVLMSLVLSALVLAAHHFFRFLDSDLPLAFAIIVVGGPTAALTVRYVSGVRSN